MISKLLNYLDEDIKKNLDKVSQNIINNTESNLKSVNSSIKNLCSGKKIRAILSLVSFMLCNKNHNNEIAINTASAIELIHNATLFHDDVIDDNDTRRGRKNLKSVFGNKNSILVGDFILSVAFKLITKLGNIEAVELLSETAFQLSVGELKQLELAGKIINETEYFDIISAKTAVLFSAGCEITAILTGKLQYREPLKNFGYNLGMAFQIIDDVLDYSGDDNLGKEIGNDFYNFKFTLPCIIAYKKASSIVEKEFWKQTFFRKEKNFNDAIYYINKSNAIDESILKAKEYIRIAEDNLLVFGDDKHIEIIKNIIIFMTERNN